MGQHRTKEQKKHAELRRIEKVSGLYSLPGNVNSKLSLTSSSNKKQVIQDTTMILKDLKKTLFISGYILALLLIVWWRI